VSVLVMGAAKWDNELVAGLAVQGSRLGDFRTVGIARGLLAQEARLLADKQQALLRFRATEKFAVAIASGLGYLIAWESAA
jgi:hypothetical protein